MVPLVFYVRYIDNYRTDFVTDCVWLGENIPVDIFAAYTVEPVFSFGFMEAFYSKLISHLNSFVL